MPTANRTLYEKGQEYRALAKAARAPEDPVVRVHSKGVTAARMRALNGGGPISFWRAVSRYSQWRLLRC